MPTSQDPSQILKAPSFPIKSILENIPTVRAAFAESVGQPCGSVVLFAMAKKVAKAMGLKDRAESAVHESILNFMVGRPAEELFSQKDVKKMGVRFAGQILRLRNGQSIIPWCSMSPLDWSVVQIVDINPGVRLYKNQETSGKIAKMFGIAGPLSGEMVDWFFPLTASRHLAIKMGFSRFSKGKYPKESDRELCQLRLAIQAESREKKPIIKATDCSSSIVSYNREVMAKRMRRDFDCPFSYHHQCHQCPHGSNECPAAVRYSPLEMKTCSECKQEQYHSAETWAPGVCIRCASKRRNRA